MVGHTDNMSVGVDWFYGPQLRLKQDEQVVAKQINTVIKSQLKLQTSYHSLQLLACVRLKLIQHATPRSLKASPLVLDLPRVYPSAVLHSQTTHFMPCLQSTFFA